MKLHKILAAAVLCAALAGCTFTTEPIITETTTMPETTTSQPTTTTAETTTTTEATVATFAPIDRGEIDPSKPMIALTFDDGPTDLSPDILDVLDEKKVVASFFVIGNNITENTEDIIIREHESGHEINNHSRTHSQMGEMSAEDIKAEILYTSDKVEELIGIPTAYFRPPYINTSETMYEAIDLPFICGYLPNDYMDTVDTQMRIDNVMKNAVDGQIILLHDFSGNVMTLEALPDIIDGLKDKGFQFVTVSELFEYKNITPEEGNMYSRVF
jgi:peptidoglycan/xylan/chitin deacetylase (PgdA/CDA1 family)